MQRPLAIVGSALIIGACSSSQGDTNPLADQISAAYVDIAANGFVDQTVTFENDADVALVPQVSYQALDKDGHAVAGVEVTTAFGSDRSLLVIPPSGYFDVLTFVGDRVGEVVDVEIEITDVASVSGYDLGDIDEPDALAKDGTPLTKSDVFSRVALTNSSEDDVYFRVVCLLYDSPEPGNAQQALDVSVVIDPTLVAAGERIVVPVSSAFTDRTTRLQYGCGSLKLHPTPPPAT